jgi:hypothetical protein
VRPTTSIASARTSASASSSRPSAGAQQARLGDRGRDGQGLAQREAAHARQPLGQRRDDAAPGAHERVLDREAAEVLLVAEHVEQALDDDG